jgi:D-alanine-D-alanine ligase
LLRAAGRASQNVEFVERLEQVPAVVSAVAGETNNLVLVEKFLGGKEYCIAVMGAGPAGALAFSPVERCLEADEKVFTSMDIKAITAERVRPMDPAAEADVVARLQELGEAVYNSFNLTSLVRLDIRADAQGQLYILVSRQQAGGLDSC